MCLSTAYKLDGGEEHKVGEYISSVSIDGGVVTLTDILGGVIRIDGRLKSIDLEKNVILIEAGA